MAIAQNLFKLQSKKQLTHDVLELVFVRNAPDGQSGEVGIPSTLPGQYVLFDLPSGLKRAYSISYSKGDEFYFIIKRLSHSGAGSQEVCDLPIGGSLPGMGPIGRFTLSEGDIPRLFIGTGTGFAPLYYQVRALEDRSFQSPTHFVFGVRNREDMFYRSEFERLAQTHPHFHFTQYLSKGEVQTLETAAVSVTEKSGHVTNALTPGFVAQFQEFYVCGSPVMVKDVRATLEEQGIAKEKIRFEQY